MLSGKDRRITRMLRAELRILHFNVRAHAE